ncbi:hypothetical protein LRS74_06120 [Streptomyces sp. LX-29]|uniref:serpin family protein n=1 Tax=Streptomyces sp. LX-29 TaxID=2900152 RepID=UPI00240E8C39|nr:serpin family protein [Streptomyces sp. LX-29]WFB06665.1 hypothetical protein LRS74_06120 [Streptomyces sp. LX-29]
MLATETIRSVNELTGWWARSAVPKAAEGTVFSAAGVWPLLALLAGGADGRARGELHGALSIAGADSASARGRELIEALGAMEGVAAATGLWTRAERVPLRPVWAAALPPGVHADLTGDLDRDRAALDAWATRHTDGQITGLPVPLTADTLLVLAGALLLRTRWTRPFGEGRLEPDDGPWRGRRLTGLYRSGPDLDLLRVAPDTPAGPLTLAEVAGDNGLEVRLVRGAAGVPGGEVLQAAVAVLEGEHPALPGSALPYGEPAPGVRVVEATSWEDRPTLNLATVRFTVRAEHDLLDSAGLFGLRTATDPGRGHFPGISPTPLAVTSARQSMTAGFTATGFEAAAVTSVGMGLGGVPRQRSKQVGARFDQPFGFLARHRASGLILAAGWVTDPDKAPNRPW